MQHTLCVKEEPCTRDLLVIHRRFIASCSNSVDCGDGRLGKEDLPPVDKLQIVI